MELQEHREEPMSQGNPLWDRDDIQFPRLLAEIQANIDLTQEQWYTLCSSMDLETDDLAELFDRAQLAWEKIKAKP